MCQFTEEINCASCKYNYWVCDIDDFCIHHSFCAKYHCVYCALRDCECVDYVFGKVVDNHEPFITKDDL